LVHDLGASVEKVLEFEEGIEGSALAIAVKTQQPEMVRLLVEGCGADINDKVTVNGLDSTLLHLGLRIFSEYVKL
jgi:hypothetical protein